MRVMIDESGMRALPANRLSAPIAFGLLILALIIALETRAEPADLGRIRLPEGFRIEVFAADVPNARSMALGDYTLFVGTRTVGDVYAIPLARRGDGTVMAGETHTLVSGLRRPNGVAFRDGDLFVAEVNRIIRFEDVENRLDSAEYSVVADDFPSVRAHGWKYIAFGPDDKLYVPIGAPCNVCDRPGFAVITRMDPDGSNREVFAEGVRNTVGFTWHPGTGVMWFTDNGRDRMGDDVPSCELNRAPAAGIHFGFPYCHGGNVPDPDFSAGRSCDEFAAPAIRLGAHVAPLGLKFYDGQMFPEEYRGQLFVAEHGSWNRSEPVGYRITLVRFENGEAVGRETFADGWLQDGESWGRPVDVLVLADDSLLVSDDKAGRIYRIVYSGDSQVSPS
ncbi:MAG: PQQ-dependent sugar dehydrogenase [Chromatiales bacterium]|nr:PQQ-dependent sugar dehydrogenase [Chromatiales bacterium]